MSRDYVLQPFRAPIHLQIDYAGELNEQQLAAVTAPPGPSLVIAGAGSGKTRTLTYRVAYLLEQGIPPDRVLLLTFTNKAAKEMMRRVADLLGQELPQLWGGTFHAIGNRILRQHAGLLGYQRDFTILDREDARHLIKTCVAESDIDIEATRFPKPEVLGDIFSLSLNTHRSIPEVLADQYEYFEQLAEEIADIEGRYEARKRAGNSMDFDDLLALWLRLLRDHAETREHYQRRFQFILVDEYQDTNKLQSDLIDLLAERHHNVMVVGDDAQSIYAWRGANFQNILKFPRRYPEAKIYKIETNYRSTPEILEVANATIKGNEHQFSKELAPARKAGSRPGIVACEDAAQQAVFVAQRVLELREEGTELNKMAVLYRSHFHALELQLELTRHNIPFSITSGIRYFEQAHIKDVTAYLKFVTNPRDELSFKRLVQLLPGIGGRGAEKLWGRLSAECGARSGEGEVGSVECGVRSAEWKEVHGPKSTVRGNGGRGKTRETGAGAEAKVNSREIGETAQSEGRSAAVNSAPLTPHSALRTPHSPLDASPLAVRLQACAASVPKKAAVAWAQFVATVAQLDAEPIRGNPSEMIRLVLEAGYEDYLDENYANYRSRFEEIEQLAVFARQFLTLEDFLTQLALLSNLEAESDRPVTRDDERLRLSTVHQAKGLEFDVVFVIMLCDGLFPSARSIETEEGEEEERRLMYVAITRARNELYLSYPHVRAGFGSSGDTIQRRSRFLEEIPEDLVEVWNLKPYG